MTGLDGKPLPGFRPGLLTALVVGFLLGSWQGVVAVLALDAVFQTR